MYRFTPGKKTTWNYLRPRTFLIRMRASAFIFSRFLFDFHIIWILIEIKFGLTLCMPNERWKKIPWISPSMGFHSVPMGFLLWSRGCLSCGWRLNRRLKTDEFWLISDIFLMFSLNESKTSPAFYIRLKLNTIYISPFNGSQQLEWVVGNLKRR